MEFWKIKLKIGILEIYLKMKVWKIKFKKIIKVWKVKVLIKKKRVLKNKNKNWSLGNLFKI